MDVHSKSKSETIVAIVGAGIAGLAAAQRLFSNGFKNVIILEAQDRVGGRVHTIPFSNGILELGAQWLHGEGGNPLYEFAKERDLICCPELEYGIEGDGHFCTDTGEQLTDHAVNHVIEHLDQIKQDLCDNRSSVNNTPIVSAGHIFKERFTTYISSNNSIINDNLLWGLFNWYMRFEMIDNACKDLNDLSIKAYTEWYDCDGVPLINLKSGYLSLTESLMNDIPQRLIQLNKCVELIEVLNDNEVPKVKLTIKGDSNNLYVDHVIITSSIGYLQKNLNTLFKPPLPENKIKIIQSIGFGTVNKIFLEFQSPFWKTNDLGFQLIWTCKTHEFLPSWVYHVSGFDIVRDQPNVLMGWIGGDGAEEIELVKDDNQIGIICAKVLRMFLPNLSIPDPSRVIISRWYTNEYFNGAYSHRSITYEQSQLNIMDLSDPIVYSCSSKVNWPCILFAGEATDREFYSSTHGALRSGWREAQRIIEFWT